MLNKQENDYSKLFPTASTTTVVKELLMRENLEKSYYAAMREILKEQPILAYKQMLEDKVEEFKVPIYISSLKDKVELVVSELTLNYYGQLTQKGVSSDGVILNKLADFMSSEEIQGIRYKALRNAVVRIGNELDLTKDQQEDIHLDGDLIEDCIQHGHIAYIQIEEEIC